MIDWWMECKEMLLCVRYSEDGELCLWLDRKRRMEIWSSYDTCWVQDCYRWFSVYYQLLLWLAGYMWIWIEWEWESNRISWTILQTEINVLDESSDSSHSSCFSVSYHWNQILFIRCSISFQSKQWLDYCKDF